MKRLTQFLLALGLVLWSGVPLMAATSTWDGDTDSFWTTLGNWDTAPVGGEDILFPSVANQTVDLNATTPAIATLTFNSPNAYSVANGTLTLGGDVAQSGAGAVTLNSATDLGGATRVFNGSGSGVVTFNGAVTGDGYSAMLNGGNWVIANNANTIYRWEITGGAIATMVGAGTIAQYNNPSYFGGNGGASFGGYSVKLDGGTLDFQATETGDTPSWGTAPKDTATMGADWWDRAIVFGPNGGTLIWTNAPAGGGLGNGGGTRNGPSVYYSQGGTGTIIVGEPLPYSGDVWDGTPASTNRFRSPFEVEYGFSLGIYQNSSLHTSGSTPYYKWRQGWGDIVLILTNGASAYLDWNVMTNGNFIIKGQPGGDSSVIETNATGWTRNVGRLAIRGPHRNGIQYSTTSAADAPAWAAPGVIDRSFYMDQPNGMLFYDAVQVWNRDGMERLACDMSFETGSSVDFCGGRRNTGLDLGHCGNEAIGQAGPTNTMTIKSGAKCNLNLQLRSNIGDGRTSPYGESAGLRVWSFIDIKDGGELKIYRSQTNAMGKSASGGGGVASKCIELFRPVIGNGSTAADARFIVDLPYSPPSGGGKNGGGTAGNNGVSFEANPSGMGGSYPGALPIVNGTGRYGLRLEGNGECLTNYLFAVRSGSGVNALTGLTGSGGVLTLAATDTTGSMTISEGPASNPGNVRLGFIGNPGYTYVLNPGSISSFFGILVKQGRVKLGNGLDMTGKNLRVGDEGAAVVALDDSATATMGQLVLIGDTTLEMGTAGGSAAVMNLANSSAAAWTAGKTLTIVNWNGNTAGGGPDQIFFGTDATGLSVAQLAQIKWIAPGGGADVTGAAILASGEVVPNVPSATEITSPAIVNGEFVFQVVPGVPTQTSVIQMATNLAPPVYWENVTTNTGTFSFTNSIALPESYFRVLVP